MRCAASVGFSHISAQRLLNSGEPMSKFGALAADVEKTIEVKLINPKTGEVICDKDGKASFIEVLSTDSQVGREFDKARRKIVMDRAMRSRNQLAATDDQLQQNQAKLAKLTRSWYLVDPATKEQIPDYPCTEENAKELYSFGGTAHVFRQVWLDADETANFIGRSSES
jgi:hypothetical protein